MKIAKEKNIQLKGKIKSERTITISSEKANANSFKHLLTAPTANPYAVQWVSQLRANKEYKKMKQSRDFSVETPKVYYKTTKSSKEKHSSADISEDVNISAYEHLAVHRLGTKAPSSLIEFETSLRKDEKSKKIIQLEKNWTSIPKKDRHEEPKFIKTKSLRKKEVHTEDLENASDGLSKYPRFTEKVIKVRNYNQFRHMLKGQVNLPSIGWQTNLRSY